MEVQSATTNPLQAQVAQSLLSVMSTFAQLQKAATRLSSDIHRRQEATNLRLSDACRRFREVEAEAPAQIFPVVARGEPFRQPKEFSSGLFLRHTAPEEVNAFRARAEPKPDFQSLEKFRSFLSNPPDKFTTSRPEYFLDCWLQEEEARQKQREYKPQGTQTKRPREEKQVIPPVYVKRLDKFGNVKKILVREEVVVDSRRSQTPSLEEYFVDREVENVPDVPLATTPVVTPVEPVPCVEQGLPKPTRVKVKPTPPPFQKPIDVPEVDVSAVEEVNVSFVEEIKESAVEEVNEPSMEEVNVSAVEEVNVSFVEAINESAVEEVNEPAVEEVNVSAVEEVNVSKPFLAQITSGPGIAGLTKVPQEPKVVQDYRPPFFSGNQNRRRPPLERVPPQEEKHPLWDKLKAMRMLMEPEELQPPLMGANNSLESNWSDASSMS